jgi:predicted nucleic acid-binding protein
VIVVSNTSPLTNLAAIGQFELLHQLYRNIHIADGVWAELNAFNQSWPGSNEVSAADWITQHTVQNQALVTALRRDLDRGEAETITLSIELDADLVLLDEKPGRQIAKSFGLRVAGVLGILLEAKIHNLLPAIKPALDDLIQQAGFYLSDELYSHVLTIAEESHSPLHQDEHSSALNAD